MNTIEKEYYYIDEDTGYMHQDCGPWRSYTLVAEGSTFEELLADAHIFEVDQDGGSLGDYKLEDIGGELYDIAEAILKSKITN